jgi:peptidyl-tRNA hydrolase
MHLQTNAPAGSYERLLVGIDTDSSVSNLMSYVLQPLGEKLDKEMKELRERIAYKGGNGPSSRKNRKTRKNRK